MISFKEIKNNVNLILHWMDLVMAIFIILHVSLNNAIKHLSAIILIKSVKGFIMVALQLEMDAY